MAARAGGLSPALIGIKPGDRCGKEGCILSLLPPRVPSGISLLSRPVSYRPAKKSGCFNRDDGAIWLLHREQRSHLTLDAYVGWLILIEPRTGAIIGS